MVQSTCSTTSASAVVHSPSRQPCRPRVVDVDANLIASAAHDLTLDDLSLRLAGLGPLEDQPGFCYVVRTVRLRAGTLVQPGSAPNFSGGYITLNTCKHSMRVTLPVEQWEAGVWVAGMSSWNVETKKQQSLVYLMRVGEAYGSQFELVQGLNSSGRTVTVQAKNSTRQPLGDIIMANRPYLPPTDRHDPANYLPPMIDHAHRHHATDTQWEQDVNYISDSGQPAALLVGDPRYSFTWSRQLIRNKKPGSLRPYRGWDLGTLMENLENFPA